MSVEDIGKLRRLIHRVKEVTLPKDSITFPPKTSLFAPGHHTDVPALLNSDLFDQGDPSSGCGNAPDTSLNDNVRSEFTTREPGLILF